MDDPTNDSKVIHEHSNFIATSSIKSDNMSSYLQWCFIGSNKQRDCCTCNNTVLGKPEVCSQADWHLETSYGQNTEYCSYEITCTLTVNNIAMKYDGGMFVGEAIFTSQLNKTHLVTKTDIKIITPDNYTPHIIAGSGALVGVIVIVIISIHVIRVQWRRRNYQLIQSSPSSSLSHPGTMILTLIHIADCL